MRRLLLPVLVLVVTVAGLAAQARPAEQLCWTGAPTAVTDPTTDGAPFGAQEGCDTAGRWDSTGYEAFEPTMGAAPDGSLYYATTPDRGIAVGWAASVAASADGGQSWTDIRPNTAGIDTPPETNDPYTYVDPGTGRVLAFHMGPILTCSIMAWTDDGGQSWDSNPVGCAPTGVWDHQTMVAARPVDGVETSGYPNVLVQCVNAIYAAECGRSLDGGRTWLHTVPVHANSQAANNCGAQHGHLAADEAGNIYLPTSECGSSAIVYVSRDSGFTWERNVIDSAETPFEDPAIAVDADGTIHAVWADFHGAMLYSASTDSAATWSEAVRISPAEVTGKMPSIVAGDSGGVAVVFVGTDDYPYGYQTSPDDYFPEDVEWGGFVTWSTNAGQPGQTWTTVEATGIEPLMRGDVCDIDSRCQHQVDFLGSTITPDGRVFGALIDACPDTCTIDTGNDISQSKGNLGTGVVVTIPGLDLCEATCPRFPPGSGEALDAGTPMTLPLLSPASTASMATLLATPVPSWVQRAAPANPYTAEDAIRLKRRQIAERNAFLFPG